MIALSKLERLEEGDVAYLEIRETLRNTLV
jgi:hypothetical protein